MVVVPHRPWYRAVVFCVALAAMAALSWMTYRYGVSEGIATRVEVVNERDQLRANIRDSEQVIDAQRQQIADLRVGGQIDSRATEEVRQSVESLQNQVAELNEEIRFYKGVMLPNVEEKGLRIERLDLRNAGNDKTWRYSLLLTQVVDKHEYVAGGVTINLLGRRGNAEASLPLGEVSEGDGDIKFRFRYFQNIDGELTIPDGFEPREVSVVAEAAGRDGQRLEKKFQWQTGEG